MLSRSKKAIAFSAVAIVIVIVLVASAFLGLGGSGQPVGTPTPIASTPTPTATPVVVAEKKPFYFGVTYCGNSTDEAKQLIDTVKNYTNLFVIQSGPLMSRLSAVEEICDYAVDSGLNIIVYYGYNGAANNACANFTKIAESRWGSHFMGLYYNDEPGGKMLDNSVSLVDPNGTSVNAGRDGSLYVYANYSENPRINRTFYGSGDMEIHVDYQYPDGSSEMNTTSYFTNGTIHFSASLMLPNYTVIREPELWFYLDGTVEDENGTLVTDHGGISQFTPYQQVWDSRPLQTQDEVANLYVNAKRQILSSTIRNQTNIKLMTSDYALYWYDYLAGYDTVFAELGWNNNPTQEIGLVRGAANMQGKEWGTVITWASNNPPYLQTAEQMYNQMVQSYESGAEYVIVFNYTPEGNTLGLTGNSTRVEDGVGLLQAEHFEAMEKFWNDIVLNPQKTNNVSAEAAFVLPNSYGSGMRYATDKIWGLWNTTSTSHQIWTQLQSILEQYGQKLDIVYDDPAFPVNGKYDQTVYWNQTG
ncbi:MAG: hypothetical protein ACFCUE_05550 [Candidatus Bathyarchaeia archaeon]|jgi:hypothetical protein